MEITISKRPDALNYIVLIGEDAYEMSDNANMPNGVCLAIGNADDFGDMAEYKFTELKDAPEGMQTAIAWIVKQKEKSIFDYTWQSEEQTGQVYIFAMDRWEAMPIGYIRDKKVAKVVVKLPEILSTLLEVYKIAKEYADKEGATRPVWDTLEKCEYLINNIQEA